jgi:hypothetical protein
MNNPNYLVLASSNHFFFFFFFGVVGNRERERERERGGTDRETWKRRACNYKLRKVIQCLYGVSQ